MWWYFQRTLDNNPYANFIILISISFASIRHSFKFSIDHWINWTLPFCIKWNIDFKIYRGIFVNTSACRLFWILNPPVVSILPSILLWPLFCLYIGKPSIRNYLYLISELSKELLCTIIVISENHLASFCFRNKQNL